MNRFSIRTIATLFMGLSATFAGSFDVESKAAFEPPVWVVPVVLPNDFALSTFGTVLSGTLAPTVSGPEKLSWVANRLVPRRDAATEEFLLGLGGAKLDSAPKLHRKLSTAAIRATLSAQATAVGDGIAYGVVERGNDGPLTFTAAQMDMVSSLDPEFLVASGETEISLIGCTFNGSSCASLPGGAFSINLDGTVGPPPGDVDRILLFGVGHNGADSNVAAPSYLVVTNSKVMLDTSFFDSIKFDAPQMPQLVTLKVIAAVAAFLAMLTGILAQGGAFRTNRGN